MIQESIVISSEASSTFAGSRDLPGWIVMWSLAFAIYCIFKMVSWQSRKRANVACWKQMAYLFAWPGMDADRFLNAENINVPRPSIQEWIFAFLKLCFGLTLLIGAVPELSAFDSDLVGWTGMIGIIFSLHFGLFHLLSLVWRSCGLQADPIMDWPIASQGLAEFWGRRWNRAFRDLTYRLLFRPLLPRLGPSGSLLAGFLISGLVHDLVISMPARGGFGGPVLFFITQGAGILVERSRIGKSVGLGRGISGRIFCIALLLLPVPLLFHRPFVCNVIVPFLKATGCLS